MAVEPWLYLGDCLEVMKSVPDNSVDMICADLPYGTTQCAWDVVIPFDALWEQYLRIASYHPTQKPVAWMAFLVSTYTNPGQVVMDNTMGSGTTGVACLQLNRRFLGIERDEVIFGTAKARLDAELIRVNTPDPQIDMFA